MIRSPYSQYNDSQYRATGRPPRRSVAARKRKRKPYRYQHGPEQQLQYQFVAAGLDPPAGVPKQHLQQYGPQGNEQVHAEVEQLDGRDLRSLDSIALPGYAWQVG